MVILNFPRREKNPTERKEAWEKGQQPLDGDGWTNDRFDEKYGKDKNPYKDTERDRSKKKWSIQR
jgi:hypothetical protein